VSKSASEIDAHVGQRIRQRREALGISQGRLGRHLGLTFSQVQKYEKGSNRVGAGRLFQIAAYLKVPTSYFFDGLDDEARNGAAVHPPEAAAGFADELRVLTEAFSTIRTRTRVPRSSPSSARSPRANVRATASSAEPHAPAVVGRPRGHRPALTGPAAVT
jgi:transcriptional regulator with XRE-family HTH domain